MAFKEIELSAIQVSMGKFLEVHRPPEKIRDLVDLAYRIENQSVIIFEIRPHFLKPKKKVAANVAKATFLRSRNVWKVYWERADLKWHSYTPKAELKTFNAFLKLVAEDQFCCFFG